MECNIEEFLMLWDRVREYYLASDVYAGSYMQILANHCLEAMGLDHSAIHYEVKNGSD